jgi:O-methyltransferase
MTSKVGKFIKKSVNRLGIDIVKHYPAETNPSFPKDFDTNIIQIIERVSPFTMTSKERIYALCDAVKYITCNQIPGDIVECGVWKGGSMMAVAEMLLHLNSIGRNLYLFDTFEGMTKPGVDDIAVTGESASALFEKKNKKLNKSILCYAPLDTVKKTVNSVGYPEEKIYFISGKVENTIPESAPRTISLLRLDTDWYESTYHELNHLFPRISQGGVIIIDDYGWWEGAKKAVDQYIIEKKVKILLTRIDYTGRIGIVSNY